MLIALKKSKCLLRCQIKRQSPIGRSWSFSSLIVSTLNSQKSFFFGAETYIIGAETNKVGAETAGLFHIRRHFKYKGGICVFYGCRKRQNEKCRKKCRNGWTPNCPCSFARSFNSIPKNKRKVQTVNAKCSLNFPKLTN